MFIQKENAVSYKNDVFFKFALASNDKKSKMILHFIIHEVTGIEPVESIVLNGEIIPEHLYGKKIVLDVHVKDIFGNIFDIEMQVAGARDYLLKRFEYYGATLLVDQIKKGENYNDLKPVFQIIFMDGYTLDDHDLIEIYEMRTEKGKKENINGLIHRAYVHLPLINEIAKEKGMENMSAFEKVCYLFKNNKDSAIMKTEEKVVRLLMEKYEKMVNNEPMFTLAQMIEIGKWQEQSLIEGSHKDGLAEGEQRGILKGIQEGIERGIQKGLKRGIQKGRQEGIERGIQKGRQEGIQEGRQEGRQEGVTTGYNKVLQQQIQTKYGIDASKWLSTLPSKQLEEISMLLLTTNTYEELQRSITHVHIA